MNQYHRFHLEINSMEEFILFCALIRGEKSSDPFLQALAKKLDVSSKDLEDALESDKTP